MASVTRMLVVADEMAISIMLHRIIGSIVTGLFQNIQEQMKALVFVFVFIFVLVDEQAIRNNENFRDTYNQNK